MTSASPWRRAFLHSSFFLSGASALVYEIVWMRELALVAGATTVAVSIVLAVFMGGLALGARLFGGWAGRSRRPLILYGALEAAIGLCALLLPTALAAAQPAYLALARDLRDDPSTLGAARLALAAAVLLVPTMAMGATFPVLMRQAIGDGVRVGRELGALYGTNLLGAVAGSVAGGFWLVPRFGLHGATLCAAAANLLVGAAAVVAGWRGGPVGGEARATPPEMTGGAGARAGLPIWALLAFSGFASMASEVLWSRVLVFAFSSTVHAFTLILAVFLLGLALGSWLLAFGERRAAAWLPAILVLAGVAFVLAAPLAAGLPAFILQASRWLGYGSLAYVAIMGAGASMVMLVPATLMGLVFPLACTWVARGGDAGRALGRAYLVNTCGGIAGCLATPFLIFPLLGLRGGWLLLASIQALLGLLMLAARRERRAALVAAAGFALALAWSAAQLPGPSPFDRSSFTIGPLRRILAHRDDPNASVSVVESTNGFRTLRIDGFEAATDAPQAGYMAMMAHIPLLMHPDARDVLVICFGTGTTAGTGLLYPAARVDVVDINSTVLALADHFASANRGVAHHPRARLLLDDGRNHLLTTQKQYDVVTSEPMPPTFAGVVNLYSREYYALARERLRPGGVMVQWLPFHLVTELESRSILRTVQEVFPDTTLWLHSDTGVIVAWRDHSPPIDLEALARRWSDPAIAGDLGRLGLTGPGSFASLYTLGPETVAAFAAKAPVVTDDRPSLEFHPPRHRLAPHQGTYSSEAVAALTVVYELRRRTPLPLAAATAPAARKALESQRRIDGHALLGDLFLASGVAARARDEYVLALGLAPEPAERAAFLYALSQAALAQGRAHEALAFVDECLALVPDSRKAQALREALVSAQPLPTPAR